MSEQTNPKTPRRLIPLNVAARRLGVKPGTLYRWKCVGDQQLTFYKVGGGVKLDVEEIDQYINSCRVAPPEAA
jgi:excisionase family DNA binding protein